MGAPQMEIFSYQLLISYFDENYVATLRAVLVVLELYLKYQNSTMSFRTKACSGGRL